MALNVKKGDIVEFRGSKYLVEVVSSSGSFNSFLIGGMADTKSCLLWLTPLTSGAEETGGWINERKVKMVKRK